MHVTPARPVSAVSNTAHLSNRRSLRDGLETLLGHLHPVGWRLLRRGAPNTETVLATFGAMQIRRTRAGFAARTVVKGEPDPALRTALQRLTAYRDGDNRERLPVPVARPAVRRPGVPGTWSLQIGLPGVYDEFAAPVPRSGKVRIVAQPSETLAILRRSGQPHPRAQDRAAAAMLAVLADTNWRVAGPPMVRLHVPPGWLPWIGWFELAIPVTEA